MPVTTSVADPHQFEADLDPACHFDADPDPDSSHHFDADPDPSFQIKAQNLEKSAQPGSYSIGTFWFVICKIDPGSSSSL
jgi:hypothetical protein